MDTIYSNGLEEQLNITSDYAHCEKLITELRNSISIATEELEELKEKYNEVSLEIQSIEQKVHNSQELLSYSSFFIKTRDSMRYMNPVRGNWKIYKEK